MSSNRQPEVQEEGAGRRGFYPQFLLRFLSLLLGALLLIGRFHLDGRQRLWKLEERERNVLFNDALNTFYLRLYGVRHMVKDHSDSEKGNPLPPHGLLFPINSKGSFICTISTDTYLGLCYTSRGALAGTRNSSMGLP